VALAFVAAAFSGGPFELLLRSSGGVLLVANLEVAVKSYWLYTNDPFDNRKRREMFETYEFEEGLEVLAGGHRY
jgi:hypothetical protein